MTLDEHRTF